MEEKMLEKIKEHVEKEPYVKLFNIKLLELKPGYSVARMQVSQDHKNLHSATHGGAIFSLLDVAFGSAANSYGIITVALNVEVNYIRPSSPGDVLTATATEISRGKNVGTYNITIKNQKDKIIASSQAIGFIIGKKLPFLIQDKE
jgi:acyl-CoA thioesterase